MDKWIAIKPDGSLMEGVYTLAELQALCRNVPRDMALAFRFRRVSDHPWKVGCLTADTCILTPVQECVPVTSHK